MHFVKQLVGERHCLGAEQRAVHLRPTARVHPKPRDHAAATGTVHPANVLAPPSPLLVRAADDVDRLPEERRSI